MRPLRSTLGVFACLRYAVLTLPTVTAVRADLPTGGQVVAGSANISTAANAMSIRQTTPNAIINWQSFNIGAGDRVNLQQPSAQAAMLARVVGKDPSTLLGSLNANGSLFLINPHGVLIGSGAVIDTNHFVASTLDVSDDDFLSGRGMTFRGDSTAGIINLGTIKATEGNVLLFGHTVTNAGAITAEKGTVGLAAASEVFLAAPDAPGIVVRTHLPASTATRGVDNSGTIRAAQAQLEAAGGSIYDLAINQTGRIQAVGVETRNGRVFLTADGGTVGVGGEVTAHNADGNGGEILIGGDYRGGNPAVANATHTVVTADATLDASAISTGASGGRVIVWADDATRFLGRIAAKAGTTGGDGGFVEVSGRHDLDFRPATLIDLSAPAGKAGTLLLDPAAITISSGTTNNVATSGTNPFVFTRSGSSSVLNVTTLAAQLNTTNVTVDTSTSSGDVNFNSALAWTSNNTLRVNAGGTIAVNADITGGATSELGLYVGKNGSSPLDGLVIGSVSQSAASTITVGTLTIGQNTAANVSGETYNDTPPRSGSATFNGVLHVGTLQRDLSAGFGVLFAQNAANAIDTFRTTGSGGDSSGFQITDGSGGLDVMLSMTNVDSGYMEFVTPGALRLLAGSTVSLQNQTDVVFASTAGEFTNLAGAGAFGANARYLIYTGTTAGTQKNGLTGTNEFNRTFAGDPPGNFSGDTTSRFLYRATTGSPILTYTADNKSRVYAGSDPTFTATVTGLTGGDILANVVTGAPAFSATATQSSGVGSYAINVTRNTLNSSTYDFAFTPGTLSITAAPLTITANNFTRTINTANPAFTASYSGFVLGQDSSVVSGLQFATTAVLASAAGSYPITPSGATAANYTITYVPGTLTVSSTAPLTITANNLSKTYGAANPSFTAAFSGFIGGDTASVVTGLQFSTTATQTSGVGTYAITPFGASATGYVITYVPGTLTINPASLTLSAAPISRVYGDANPALTPQITGLVAGDTAAVVSGLTLSTSATASSNAGDYAINVAGGTAANYTITRVNGTVTVTAAPVTVRADNKSRVYGDANPALTYQVSGLKNGDSEASAFQVVNFRTLANASDSIGSYGIFIDGVAASANYSPTFSSGTLTVTPRPLTITADNKTKVYGDPFPALTASFSGLASFDSASVIPNLKLSMPTVVDGVQTVGIFVDSGSNPNYSITRKPGQLTITPAPLFTGTTLLDWTRVYGRETPAAPVPAISGLVGSDTITDLKLSFTNVPTAKANAGNYTYGLAIDNPNYQFNSPPTGTFRVDPAPLTIQLGGGSRLYGDANPASFGTQVQGIVSAFGDTVDAVLKIVNPAADRTTPPGIYPLFPQILSPNYTLGTVTGGNFTVFPRNITFTVDNQARYYGDPNPTLSYRIGGDGLASFDNAQSLVTSFGLDRPVTPTSDVGTYAIKLTLDSNPNYKVASVTPGSLVVLPRPIEVYTRNAVGYSNNSQPDGFDAAKLGLDFVDKATGPGFSAVFLGLPEGVSVKDAFPNLTFESRGKTAASAVGTATTKLSDIFPGDTRTLTPPAATKTSSESKVPGVEFGLPLEANSVTVGDKTFADTVLNIVPTRLDNKNYVVTTIVHGLLTWKADRNVTEQMITDQLFKVSVEEAKKQFYWTDTPGTTRTGAFGFTQDMFPVLRDLLLDMLSRAKLEDGGILEQVFGDYMADWDKLSSFQREGYMVMWLSDIHTNAAKQAVMLPSLCDFAIRSASVEPEKNTPQQKAVLTALEPYLLKAQQDYAKQLKYQEEKWQKEQASAKGVADFMLGTDMLEDITGNALAAVTKQTTDQLNVSVKSLVEHATVAPAVGGAAFVATAEGFRQNLDTLLAQNSNYKTATNMAEHYAKLENELYGGRSRMAVKGALGTPEALGKQNAAFIEAADNAAKNFKFQPSANELANMSKAADTLAEEMAGKGPPDLKVALGKLGFDAPDDIYATYTGKIAEAVQKDGTREAAMKTPEALAKAKAASDSAFESAFESATGKKFADDISGLSDDALKKGLDAAEKAAKKAEGEALAKVGDDAYKAAKLEKATVIAKELIAEQAEATAKKTAMKEAGDAAAKKVVEEITVEATKEYADKTAVKILVKDVGNVAIDRGIEGGAKLSSEAGKDLAQSVTKITESKVVSKIATEGAETAAEKLAAKAVAELGEEAAEKMVAKVAARAVTAATKLAGLAKAAIGGPAGIVEILADLGTQAVISAVQRGDQEKELHKLENTLMTQKADPHEAAKTSLGQATMMMALLNMMGQQPKS